MRTPGPESVTPDADGGDEGGAGEKGRDRPLLEIRGLHVSFETPFGQVRAVDGVDLVLGWGEMLGLVGESGSGKSALARAVVKLLPGNGTLTGSVTFAGTELARRSAGEMRQFRGSRIGMIFQDPMRSLNPVMSVGAQIAEAVRLTRHFGRRRAEDRARELLELVHIPEARRRLGSYPHELSGGMRQRVMIAIALAGQPSLLIADEPTTSLDATTQAGILKLIDELRAEFGMGVLLITHDVKLAARYVDRVCIMYRGKILEEAPYQRIFGGLRVPYARGLVDCIPQKGAPPHSRLPAIAGRAEDAASPRKGCRFVARCPAATQVCWEREPGLVEMEPGHSWACWHPVGIEQAS